MASTPFFAELGRPERRRWKKRQSLVTLKTIERVLKVCNATHLTPRQLAKMADVGHTTIARMIAGTAEPGEETIGKLHTALDAIEQTLLTQERRGEMCTYCSKKGHWRPDCPEIAARMRDRKGGR